jgi:hypothetical protein
LWSTTCSTSGSGLSPTHCQPSCLSSHLFTEVHMEISSLPLPHSLVCYQQLHPFACVSFQFVVYCSVLSFFFFCRRGVSLPRRLCWFIPGWLGEYYMMLGTHLFGLPNVSQTGLEPVASVALVAAVGVLLLSQCNVAWRSLL